ncbi:2Fe-2S iron-sulfur cluster-binding protein [Marilutibacter chinensis]|uniref:2Fe-2S iron-sulfur cluster-binding protein n=1 Tax=Marilutibacter chinensis TaxID=2912247 RepID=A0ABS9HYV4_9GAMM|nr:2Fe-2S iron-sulfur cluster-binding protein [Lysobacter chinensis]MCF7223545.1 2Fe-2S iron-sulfur cluster-binding protein [Lysobacter chinensis]
MARRFAELAFTPSVKAAQQRHGSREGNLGHELAEDRRDRIGPAEAAFIAERDSFYIASVGEEGWPYVQHRGGPRGFLRVLDDRTLGFADFRGNRQYISVGNVSADDRVSLILVDYPGRRRLKLWARARVVEFQDDPLLLARLESPDYRARVERGIVLQVEAFDWNCPQHITPRYTEAEIAPRLQALQAEIDRLRAAAAPVQVPAAAVADDADAAFEVLLRRSGQRLQVGADENLLDVLIGNGHEIPYSCRSGECATCVVPVVDGELLHRDEVLSEAEYAAGDVMCSCVSRARGTLVLDL